MKAKRQAIVDLLQGADIKTSHKGKPVSNDRLLELVKENIDKLNEGDDVDPLAATLAAAIESKAKIKVVGDDPTVAKKADPAAQPEKGKKTKAEKPAKEKKEKKSEVVRDKWNSSPDSSAGRINSVFFANKGKALGMDQVMEALDDETITRTRVRDHLRRLVTDGILTKDAKDRFAVPKSEKKSKEE